MLSWVNGAPDEQLSVRDRGLAYGDGLFETIAVRGGRIPLLARHMARLAEGCRRLSIPSICFSLSTSCGRSPSSWARVWPS